MDEQPWGGVRDRRGFLQGGIAGVKESEAWQLTYASVKEGKVVVGVHAEEPEPVDTAEEVFREHGGTTSVASTPRAPGGSDRPTGSRRVACGPRGGARPGARESDMAQVMPGHEAWSGGDGDVGVLVLHGYTSSPYGMRGLAEHIAGAGYRVELPRLPGHGTHWRDVAKTRWRDWAREAIGALETLRSRTSQQVVVGLSMGGTLALHLAETRDDLSGAILINPIVSTSAPIARFLPVLKLVLPSVGGLGNDIAKEGGDEQPYDRNPLRAQASVLELGGRVRDRLADVTCPLLVFTSRQDHVVEPINGQQILEGVSSTDTEQVWLERSYHVAQLDHDAPEIEGRTLDFIRRVTA